MKANQARFTRLVLPLGSVVAGFMFGGAAVAQADQSGTALEEIVVTAQKRSESLQTVPIAISALNASDIESRGVENTGDLANSMPNMSGFQSPGARGNIAIAMRGIIGGSPANLSSDSVTGLYIDGFLLGKTIDAAMDLAELERVEVLRGPQGTLYGRNTTGGAVNLITRKPSGEFGGQVSGTVGSDDLWALRASIDTPTFGTVGEGLGAFKGSLAMQTRKRDGLYGNVRTGGQDFDDLDRQSGRIALRWEPRDTLTVDYAHDRSELDELNTLQSLIGVTPYALPTAANPADRIALLNGIIGQAQAAQAVTVPMPFGLVGAAQNDPTFDRWLGSTIAIRDALAGANLDRRRPNNGQADALSGTTSKSQGHSLTIAWSFEDLGFLGDVEFRSLTGHRKAQVRNFGDLDGLDNSIGANGIGAINDLAAAAMFQFYNNYFPGFVDPLTAKLWDLVDTYGGGYFTQNARMDYEQFSQELQMVGSVERLQYAFGLYYFEDKGSVDNYRKAAMPLGGVEINAYDNDTEALAFYTQLTWTPSVLQDKLALTFGYRRTEEDKGIRYRYMTDVDPAIGYGLFGPGGAVNMGYTGGLFRAATYGDSFEQDFSNDSGSLTVAYQLLDDTNMFLRWSTGYRSGGFNGEIYNNPFSEETIEQLELGVKSTVIPGRLRVNGSVFQYTYDDLQVSTLRVIGATPTSAIVNAGETDRWGAEIEAQFLLTDNLRMNLSYAHLSGDYEKFPAVCGSSNCIELSDYVRRVYSPDNSVSLVTDWAFARTSRANFMAHLEVFWQDKMNTASAWQGTYSSGATVAPYVHDYLWMKERTLVNARVGIESMQFGAGTLRASLWVRNVTDEKYPNFGTNFGSLGPITEQYGEPRTYGLDVSWVF